MYNKNNEWTKINDFSESSGQEDFSDQEIKFQMKSIKKPLERPRSTVSIPSKCHNFTLIKDPEIRLEYHLPNCPEKYLLPIRFPLLYNKIVNSLNKSSRIKNQENSNETKVF